MQFSSSLVALVATTFFTALSQAIHFTNSNYNNVQSGQQVTLNWQGDGSPVDIVFESGPSGSLNQVATLVTGATGTSSTVTIPNVASGTYAFQIKQSGQVNYSPQFSVSGTGTSTYTYGYSYTTTNTPYVSQIVDGQIQAATLASGQVTQINDGQIQANPTGVAYYNNNNNGVNTTSPTPYVSAYVPGTGYGTNSTVSFLGAGNKVAVGGGAIILGGLAALIAL